jgi:hypothetical protein
VPVTENGEKMLIQRNFIYIKQPFKMYILSHDEISRRAVERGQVRSPSRIAQAGTAATGGDSERMCGAARQIL